jgi:hypothetical protein
MRPVTKEFIENWELKLSQIKNDNDQLKELYDKFTTLFTIFNRYYNEAFYQFKEDKKLTKSRYSDFEKATTIVQEFLSVDSLINSFNKNQKEIDDLCMLIENKIFHINLADGEPSEETDMQLLENLKSLTPEVKCKAVLSAIYNVRCNIVHGYKDFQEYQRLIVEPLIKLLESVIELLKKKFEE